MFSILLLLLKIIGIVFLVILGILLLLVLLILFFPICYCFEGEYKEKKPFLKGKVVWFIPGMSARIAYDERLTYSVKWFRHCFFSESSSDERENKSSEKTKKGKKLRKKKGLQQEECEEKQESGLQDADSLNITDTESGEEQKKEEFLKESSVVQQEKSDFVCSPTDENSKSSNVWIQKIQKFINKIKLIYKKLVTFWEHVKKTIENFFKKRDEIHKKISYYYELWNRDATQAVYKNCKGRLAKLFKHLKPKKFQIWLQVGMDDPATTGMIMGIWGMLYPIIGGTIHINPEFEKQVLEGRFLLKGRIRVFSVLITALQFYRDKDLKKLIFLVKKGGK